MKQSPGGGVTDAVRRPTTAGPVAPGPAPNDAVAQVRQIDQRIHPGQPLFPISVETPLVDISVQIVQTPRIRLFLTDSMRVLFIAVPGVACVPGVVVQPLGTVAAGIRGAGPRPAAVFPFRFSRQRVRPTRGQSFRLPFLMAQTVGKLPGVVPRYAGGGEASSFLDPCLSLPGPRLHDAKPLVLGHLALTQPEPPGEGDRHGIFIGIASRFRPGTAHREHSGRTPHQFHPQSVVGTSFPSRLAPPRRLIRQPPTRHRQPRESNPTQADPDPTRRPPHRSSLARRLVRLPGDKSPGELGCDCRRNFP